MKTIGLIGGMSFESSATYYKLINEYISQKLGGLNSAKVILYSVNFKEIEECQKAGDWDKSAEILIEAAKSLEKAGADFFLICTNTMHKVADKVAKSVTIPFVHIADVTAEELLDQNVSKVLLLGTKYTMEQDFYKERLASKGIDVLIPSEEDRDIINSIIFKELCVGKIFDTSKSRFCNIIKNFADNGAQGVILGCTEIGMLIGCSDADIPVFDTTIIHAQAAVKLSLKD